MAESKRRAKEKIKELERQALKQEHQKDEAGGKLKIRDIKWERTY